MFKRVIAAVASMFAAGAAVERKAQRKAPTLQRLGTDFTNLFKPGRTRFKLNAKRVPGGDKQERARRGRQIANGTATYPVYSSINPEVRL
jgi:hypothetical protein